MKVKFLIPIFAIFLISFLVSGCMQEEEAAKSVEFETLSIGYNSNIVDPSHYVVKGQDRLEEVLDKINGNKVMEINFDKNMVVAVFQGQQPTGGFEIKIREIIETDDNLNVYIEESKPGPSDIVTQALSSPYHIVKLEKIEKEVEFINE